MGLRRANLAKPATHMQASTQLGLTQQELKMSPLISEQFPRKATFSVIGLIGHGRLRFIG
jgi:hypothetical protein